MRASVYLSVTEVEPGDVQGRTAVVIDVIRATSTIVEALANGASAIYPTRSTEDALRLASSLGGRTRCSAASGRASRSRDSIWETRRGSSLPTGSTAAGSS